MDERYRFPKTLSEPMRIVVLTLDEAIPFLLVFLVCMARDALMTGVIAGVMVISIIRFVKRGRGTGWLMSLLYWYLPAPVTLYFFRHLPDSSGRHFLR